LLDAALICFRKVTYIELVALYTVIFPAIVRKIELAIDLTTRFFIQISWIKNVVEIRFSLQVISTQQLSLPPITDYLTISGFTSLNGLICLHSVLDKAGSQSVFKRT